MPEIAGPAAARIFVGVRQHDLVHVDVAVIAGQFLGFEIRHGDLRDDAQHDEARRLEGHPGQGRDVNPVRHDRQDIADIELEREQIALPAHHLHRVVAVEDRAVPAGMLDAHLVLVLLRPAVIGDVRHLQHGRVDRRVSAHLLVLAQADRLRRFDHQQQAVAHLRQLPERGRLGEQHPVARLVRDRPEFGGEDTAAAMHEIKKIALHIAIAIRHRLPPTADRHGDIVVREQCLPTAARVGRIGRDDIGAVHLARPVLAFEPHDLIRPVGAVKHCNRSGKTLPTQMLLTQIAEPDPRLTHKAPARKMDPRAHHPTSSLTSMGRNRIAQPSTNVRPPSPAGLVPPLQHRGRGCRAQQGGWIDCGPMTVNAAEGVVLGREPSRHKRRMRMAQTGTAVRPIRETVAPPDKIPVALSVNGLTRQLEVAPWTTLLDALRDHLDLTGTKKGCDHGQCGACTVLVGGRRINSCLTLAVMKDGAEVTTIEGLATDGALHALQQAFIDHDAFQCGYCTPGQICSAAGLIAEGKAKSADEIRELMSGNICRCGAYPNIVAAIQQAMGQS